VFVYSSGNEPWTYPGTSGDGCLHGQRSDAGSESLHHGTGGALVDPGKLVIFHGGFHGGSMVIPWF